MAAKCHATDWTISAGFIYPPLALGLKHPSSSGWTPRILLGERVLDLLERAGNLTVASPAWLAETPKDPTDTPKGIFIRVRLTSQDGHAFGARVRLTVNCLGFQTDKAVPGEGSDVPLPKAPPEWLHAVAAHAAAECRRVLPLEPLSVPPAWIARFGAPAFRAPAPTPVQHPPPAPTFARLPPIAAATSGAGVLPAGATRPHPHPSRGPTRKTPPPGRETLPATPGLSSSPSPPSTHRPATGATPGPWLAQPGHAVLARLARRANNMRAQIDLLLKEIEQLQPPLEPEVQPQPGAHGVPPRKRARKASPECAAHLAPLPPPPPSQKPSACGPHTAPELSTPSHASTTSPPSRRRATVTVRGMLMAYKGSRSLRRAWDIWAAHAARKRALAQSLARAIATQRAPASAPPKRKRTSRGSTGH